MVRELRGYLSTLQIYLYYNALIPENRHVFRVLICNIDHGKIVIHPASHDSQDSNSQNPLGERMNTCQGHLVPPIRDQLPLTIDVFHLFYGSCAYIHLVISLVL